VVVAGADEVVGVEQVVANHPRLVVGQVLELVGVADVPERPDPLDIRPLEVVDDHQAGVVDLHAGALDIEEVGVRPAAGRHEDDVGLDGRLRAVGHQMHPEPIG